jgi:hypothetical protein
MGILTPKNKIESRVQYEKKQEFKHLGAGTKKAGMFIFGLNPDTLEVYKVVVIKKKHFDITKKTETASNKAVINPNHRFIHSINLKNAKRKFGLN